MLQAPEKLEELTLDLINGPISVAGVDITSGDFSNHVVRAAPFFPALREVLFGTKEGFPMDSLLSGLAQTAPGLDSVTSWAGKFRDDLSPFTNALSASQILQISRWGALKSLSLPNCSVGIFAVAVTMSPVPVLLPELLKMEICFTQNKAVMKAFLECIPAMFPKLQSLDLLHDGSRIFGVFSSKHPHLPEYTEVFGRYAYYAESFEIFNLISSFSRKYPSIKIEFASAPGDEILGEDYYSQFCC